MAAEAVPDSLAGPFGSAYIGAMISMILYGITCLQTYFFFIHYPKDSLQVKLLVVSLWILDTLHVTLVSRTMYHYLITNFNNPPALLNHTWSLSLSLGVNVLIAFIVQVFFMDKIHRLSGNCWWITAPTTILILAHFAFGLETTAGFFQKKHFANLHELNYVAALPFGITTIASDIAITAALCYLLQHRKSCFQSSNSLLNTLIIYSVNRCLLTSILAVIEVIVFVALPNTLWFLALDFVIGKCYANSLFATLNTRQALRGKGLDDTEGNLGPQLSTLEAFSPTAIEIAGVTPSMISRSRSSQTGRTSLSFGNTSRTSASKSMELEEFKPPFEESTIRLSVIASSESSSNERRSSFASERREKRDS